MVGREGSFLGIHQIRNVAQVVLLTASLIATSIAANATQLMTFEVITEVYVIHATTRSEPPRVFSWSRGPNNEVTHINTVTLRYTSRVFYPEITFLLYL